MSGAVNDVYGRLQLARRVWAIAAIHADYGRLARLHDTFCTRLHRGDRIVYLGNMIGRGKDAVQTVDELIAFRRHAMTLVGTEPWDIVYLRGAQEEMWMKVAQLQFAPDPQGVLRWMINQGIGPSLTSYGIDVETGKRCCQEGAFAIMRWTATILNTVHNHPGHDELFSSLRRYAMTAPGELLFINSGLDTRQPLSEQRDSFWWGDFEGLSSDDAYGAFAQVVRGYDHHHQGPKIGQFRTSIDGGCGFGGSLNAVCFTLDGKIADWLEVT